MTKAKLKKLMKEHLVFESEIDDIFEFVLDLLEARADEIEKAYPYAFNTINRLRSAAYETYDLIDYVHEILEGEDE